jgi:gliding motility-associated-like protein
MKKLAFILLVLFGLNSNGQMTMEGVASQFGGTCSTYELVHDVANTMGGIWSPNTLDLTSDFDMIFEVFLGDNGDIWDADGMAFVLQENPDGLGGIGRRLGYQTYTGNPNPISAQSLAVEIDIFDNGATVPTDPTFHHMGVHSNGSVDHNILAPVTFAGNAFVNDNAYHDFRVQWSSGLNTMLISWDGVPFLTFTNDIVTNIFGGTTDVYWGFTSATGGVTTQTRVRVLSTVGFTPDFTTICPGNPIQFTDNSTSPVGISSWDWDFGDGGTSTSQSPSYTYTDAGTYTAELTMTDNFGCEYITTTTITIPELSLDLDSTSVTCFGDTDGTGTVTTTAPVPGTGPFVYAWNDVGTQSTSTATNLPPGIYTVTVTDDEGCNNTDSITVIEPLEITLAMDSTDESCNVGMDGTASTVVTNGVGTLDYLWDDPGTQNTATATGLAAGTYTVLVTDDDGCTATGSIEVVEQATFTIDLDSTVVTCFGGADGSASVSVVTGTGTFTYLWDDTAAQTNDTATALSAGQYIVTVTESGGCAVSDTIIVTQPPAVTSTMSSLKVDCSGNSTGEATVTAADGVTPYTYLWDDAGAQTTATASGLAVGNYSVTITDDNGCTAVNTVSIIEPNALEGTSVSTDDLGEGGTIDITVTGGTIPYSFLWDNTETTEDLTGLPEGVYTVVVTDSAGCEITLVDSVNQILDIALPSGMSPNGDGLNDFFDIIGIEAHPDNKLVVTNRWGNIVYQIEDYTNDWNGVNMDGDELPEGVYFVVFETESGEQHTTYLELRRL